jgi:hypothetical protein
MPTQALRQCFVMLFVASLLLLGGCVSVLTDPLPFNAQLAPRQPGAGPRLSCLSEENLSTCVLPGMKLVVFESDARDHTLQDRTLVESRTEWLIPRPEKFGQQDLFQLTRLLAIATPTNAAADSPIHASRCYETWIDKRYPEDFRTKFIPRFLESLTLRYKVREGESAGTADSVQQWMQALPAPGKYAGPQLYFSIPRGGPDTIAACGGDNAGPDLNLTAFGGGSPFQRQTNDDPFTVVKDALKPGWYRPDAPLLKSRSFLAVMVPVTVAGAPGLHYVPIHASLDDLPAYLGIPRERFKGVRRDIRLIPPPQLQQQPYEKRLLIRAVEGRHALADPTTLPVKADLMRLLLVAPGDEVVMSSY